MKCNYCGAEIADDSVFCEHCGQKILNEVEVTKSSGTKRVLLWIGCIASLLLPIIGFILFGVKKKTDATLAKKYLWFGVIGIVLAMVSCLISVINTNNNYYSFDTNYDAVGANAPAAEVVYSQPGEFYCDGVYGNDSHGFHTPELTINRYHFGFSFSFKADYYLKSWPLILSRRWRILGIELTSDGGIGITTHNLSDFYSTGCEYAPGEWTDVTVEYDHGTLTFNGNQIYVDMDTEGSWDNTFHSMNYSDGIAFQGYLKDVTIYSYPE